MPSFVAALFPVDQSGLEPRAKALRLLSTYSSQLFAARKNSDTATTLNFGIPLSAPDWSAPLALLTSRHPVWLA